MLPKAGAQPAFQKWGGGEGGGLKTFKGWPEQLSIGTCEKYYLMGGGGTREGLGFWLGARPQTSSFPIPLWLHPCPKPSITNFFTETWWRKSLQIITINWKSDKQSMHFQILPVKIMKPVPWNDQMDQSARPLLEYHIYQMCLLRTAGHMSSDRWLGCSVKPPRRSCTSHHWWTPADLGMHSAEKFGRYYCISKQLVHWLY